MSDEMKYEVHTEDGKVWYCKDMKFVKDVPGEHPEWVGPEIDLAMLGAVEKRYVHSSDSVPSMVYLVQSPVSVVVLKKVVVADYDRDSEYHMENYA